MSFKNAVIIFLKKNIYFVLCLTSAVFAAMQKKVEIDLKTAKCTLKKGCLPIVSTSTADYLLQATIHFYESVQLAPLKEMEVPEYTLAFLAVQKYGICQINYHIPFVANEYAGQRTKFTLYLDSQLIQLEQTYSGTNWDLKALDFHTNVMNVAKGKHSLKIKVQTTGGSVNIPHYNTATLEAQDITIYATAEVVCFK